MNTKAQKFGWGVVAFLGVATFLYGIIFYFIFPTVTDFPLGFQIHAELQRTFAEHPVGLYIHIVPSLFAILLGPFQFQSRLRRQHPAWHRWLGRLYLFGVLFGGLGGLYMAPFSFAGIVSQTGFGLLAAGWLFTGYMAFIEIRQGRIDSHRAWMMRNYALTLAAATLRIYTRSLIGLGYQAPDFHAINAWLCWLPNLIIAEWLIYRLRVESDQPVSVPGS